MRGQGCPHVQRPEAHLGLEIDSATKEKRRENSSHNFSFHESWEMNFGTEETN